MSKYASLLFYVLLCLSIPAYATKVWIPRSELNVLGNERQYTIDDNGVVSSSQNHFIAPGDIIILENGLRSYIYFKGIKGTAKDPIIITNQSGGIVEIDYGKIHPSFRNSAFRLVECQYIKVSGANSPGIRYGIKISYSYWDQPLVNGKIVDAGGTHGISLDRTNSSVSPSNLTSHIEIENCEITNVGASAISAKIDGAGNGVEGPGNIFVMQDIIVHDNYLHDIGMEGIYIGQSSASPVWHSTINVKIYDNIIARSGCEPIQIRNAWDVEVHNNVCYQASLLSGEKYGSENNGFQIERGTRGVFYNNIIMDGKNEYVRAKTIDGAVPDSLNDLPEGNLVNKLGSGIEFFNNYLDGGAETYSWDSPSDGISDYRSPSAAIYCESDYTGTQPRTTNFDGNYVRNIYTGTNDLGKPKANLEFFFIRQDNPATPEDETDLVTYNIFDNYFSGPNDMETHGSPSGMNLGKNQFLNLPEIEFVKPIYGTDNFCITPESYYYDKGVSGTRPEAKGIGLSKCIVPALTLTNNVIAESGNSKIDFTFTIYKSNNFITAPGNAVLIYKSCEQCNQKVVSDNIPISWGLSKISFSKSSFSLSEKEWSYGQGKVFIIFSNSDGIYKSNEVSLLLTKTTAQNKILSDNKTFYNKACINDGGVIVATQVNGTIQWEKSNDGNLWSPIAGANTKNYTPDADLNHTTYFRRVVSSLPSNVVEWKVLSGTIQYSPIQNNQTFVNSGDPAVLSGSPDKINNQLVGANDYQWQYSLDNITYYDIPNATGVSYDPSIITATTYYRRNLKSGDHSPYYVIVSISKFFYEAKIANCLPDSFEVNYGHGAYFNKNNVFNIQLSEPSGLFAASPLIIGTSDSTNSGTITCKLPSHMQNGNYKIRIVSTSPVIVGSESSEDICTLTAISEAMEVSSKLLIYPNPFSNNVSLKFQDKEAGEGYIYIIDMNGIRVFESAFISNEDVRIKSNLSSGVYSVIVELNGKKYVHKLVKI